MDESLPFSDRLGLRPPDAEITIREDAPDVVRDGVLMLGYACGLSPNVVRDAVCEVLLKQPANNWSARNIEIETRHLMHQASWFRVYDIAERLYQVVGDRDCINAQRSNFQRRLNLLFHEHGIGWQMKSGVIVARGSEPFELATGDAAETMRAAESRTAANELREALNDISRRPTPDVTGAIQHAMAALECVAREVDVSTDTLGKIISHLSLPPPLDTALHKLWGFASEQGRHIQEGREPQFEEAELVVTVASAISVYVLRAAGRVT